MTPPRRRKRSPEPGPGVTEARRAAPARTRSGDAEPGRTSSRPPSVEGELAAPVTTEPPRTSGRPPSVEGELGRPPSVEGELAAPVTTEPPRTSGRPPSVEGELAAPVTIIRIGRVVLGGGQPLALIGGPCAIENEKHALETAERIATIAADRRVPFIYKSSYDKANRSSIRGYRGPGLTEGLRILKKVRDTLGVPVLSDVHQVAEVAPAAEVLDVLQIPAFLCRQTDLIVAVARTGKPVNVKKGQFLAPDDMRNVVDKIVSVGNRSILLTERGTSFGYHNLVVDMRGLQDMRALGFPVVFDATHSVQLPGGAGDRSAGERKYVPALARAAVAVGIDALFMEMHEDPDRTLPDGRPLSDGPNMLRLDDLPWLLDEITSIAAALAR